MRSTRMKLAIIASLSCVLGAVSCALIAESPTESEPATGEAQEPLPIVSYNPEDFPFVTIVKDDGKGKAGGWQVARTTLEFKKWVIPHLPRKWECPITVQMPLRTELMGLIPPSRAAAITVPLAENAARSMDYDLPPGIFCKEFRDAVLAQFKSHYPEGLGARVTP